MKLYEPECGCRPQGNLYDTSAPLHSDRCPGPSKPVAQGVLPHEYDQRYRHGEVDIQWIAYQAKYLGLMPPGHQPN
jgi:hypothetical protein